MMTIMAFTTGALIAAGVYLMLRRSALKLIFGICLVGHGANLLIFTAGKLLKGGPPIIPYGQDVIEGPHTDPLPQALILTAIVIGFAVIAYAVVLVRQAQRLFDSGDTDEMRSADP